MTQKTDTPTLEQQKYRLALDYISPSGREGFKRACIELEAKQLFDSLTPLAYFQVPVSYVLAGSLVPAHRVSLERDLAAEREARESGRELFDWTVSIVGELWHIVRSGQKVGAFGSPERAVAYWLEHREAILGGSRGSSVSDYDGKVGGRALDWFVIEDPEGEATPSVVSCDTCDCEPGADRPKDCPELERERQENERIGFFGRNSQGVPASKSVTVGELVALTGRYFSGPRDSLASPGYTSYEVAVRVLAVKGDTIQCLDTNGRHIEKHLLGEYRRLTPEEWDTVKEGDMLPKVYNNG